MKRILDVLKLERQRLVLPKPWARLKFVMQVWSGEISGVPQLSNSLASGDAVPYFDGDGAWLHVHQDAVLRVAMVDDHAISGIGHNRVMDCLVPIGVRLLSRMRVSGHVVAGVDHSSGRRRDYLAAIARIRRILVGVISDAESGTLIEKPE
jgi:hypothetical protein